MTTYVCNGCNYRFESKSERRGRKCPYCGQESLSEEKSAEDLLTEE